jgi:hypothetical protein
MNWVDNPGRAPRNKDALWHLKFACGEFSTHTYTASQIRWTKTGSDWDVVQVARA